jgi:hypothetical protein
MNSGNQEEISLRQRFLFARSPRPRLERAPQRRSPFAVDRAANRVEKDEAGKRLVRARRDTIGVALSV